MAKPKIPKPIKACWVCLKRTRKYQNHHVMGITNDPDLTVPICTGCHWLETILSRYKRLLNSAEALGRLITLARFHAGLQDARTVIKYEFTKEDGDGKHNS